VYAFICHNLLQRHFLGFSQQGGGAAPGRQPAPEDEGYGALGGPGAQNQGPALRDLIKKAAPDGALLYLIEHNLRLPSLAWRF